MILGYNWFLNNPTGWLMSEKMDGVRAYWDGRNLWTRDNKLLHAPDWFLALLPQGVGLDGELWQGRGGYRRTMRIFQEADPSEVWASMRYGIFDAPKHGGTIEERAEWLAGLTLPAPLHVVPQERCRSMAHLKRAFRDVFDNGGEGLVIRRPRSAYVHARTTDYLKVKLPW